MILDTKITTDKAFDCFKSVDPDESWVSKETMSINVKDIVQSLEDDCRKSSEVLDNILLYSNDANKSTKETCHIIKLLNNGDLSFSTTSMILYAINRFGFNKAEAEYESYINALLTSGILADVKNDLCYHNNLHFQKVLLHIIRMIDTHNHIFKNTSNVLKHDDIAKLLIAACIHDLGHRGKGNIIDRKYHMAMTEKRSFELAYPYLKASGVSDDFLSDLYIMIIATDASPFGDPISPVNQVKSAYEYHFGMEEEAKLDLSDELSVLKNNDRLCLLSVMLHEADIMNSAGVHYDITKDESVAICKELGEDRAYPEDTLLFLEKICGNGMLSDSARFLADANLSAIKAKVVDDFKNGNKSYI